MTGTGKQSHRYATGLSVWFLYRRSICRVQTKICRRLNLYGLPTTILNRCKRKHGGIMFDNSVLRANARRQLGNNIFGKTWLMMVLASFIFSAIVGVASATVVGCIIIIGPLSYGYCRLLVKLVCGKTEVDFADFITGFTENFTQSLLLGLLSSLFIILWSLLFVIPGIIKSYSYSMCFYIQQQSANKDWQYCLNKSKELMQGNKMKLFLLDLSFLGWYILGALCFGIGTLFVVPYHQTARANFYMNLVADKEI